MKKKLQFVITILFMAPTLMFGTDYYVDSKQELQNRVNDAQPGDRILVRDGTYRDFFLTISRSGIEGNHIVVRAENLGRVKFRGNIGFRISGDYITLKGFDLEGCTIHPNSDDLIGVTGQHNLVEDIFIKGVSNGKHDGHRYIYFPENGRHNTINRCWFEKDSQRGISVFGFLRDKEPNGTFNVVENCYFRGERQKDNGGEGVRFGSGLARANQVGKNIVRNCLFDQYDGEAEIISLKSSENLIDKCTFRNCYGMLAFRHCEKNIVQDTYFINSNPDRVPDGNFFSIWGDGHKVINNYFYQTKPRFDKGGTINLLAGSGTAITANNESVEDLLIKDNIIYDTDTDSHGIYFGSRFGDRGRDIMPKDVHLEGNRIFSPSNKAQIGFASSGTRNTTYSDNRISRNVGINPLPNGISNNLKASDFTKDKYGVFRVDGKGPDPSCPPLTAKDVGPIWLSGCKQGASCNDGDPCTINDVLDAQCNCVGQATEDDDNDGVCNELDVCPNFDDKLIGTACDDGDLCTFNDVYTSDCECKGSEANEIALDALEDAYVQGGEGINNDVLRIENGNRIGYLKYDLSGTNNIESVSLRLTTESDAGDGDINVYMSTDVSWSEGTISANNAPSQDILLGTLSGSYTIGESYTLKLGSSLNTTNGPFSIILVHQSGNDLAFGSSEFSKVASRPKLLVNVEGCNLSATDNELGSLIDLYPNPVDNELTISNAGEVTRLLVEVYNTLGKRLSSLTSENKKVIINTSEFSSGIYFVEITDAKTNNSIVKKVIKK